MNNILVLYIVSDYAENEQLFTKQQNSTFIATIILPAAALLLLCLFIKLKNLLKIKATMAIKPPPSIIMTTTVTIGVFFSLLYKIDSYFTL